MPRFGRLLTAMVTPMHPDLAVDYARAQALAERLLSQGSEGLVVAGTTGEAPTLSAEEKLKLFAAVAEAVRGRAPVFAGTGTYNTAESVHLTREAVRTGVDGFLLTVPYYNKPTQEGLYRHFRAIAEAAAGKPCMLYNIPSRSVINLAAATTVRLARDLSNIVSIKECGEATQVPQILSEAPAGFEVYSGDDSAALPWMSVGAVGIVSVASHIVGPQMRQMIDAFFGGDVAAAALWHRKLLPVFRALFVTTNPILVKAALGELGFPVGGPRLPLIEASEAERALLRQVLAAAGLTAPVR